MLNKEALEGELNYTFHLIFQITVCKPLKSNLSINSDE